MGTVPRRLDRRTHIQFRPIEHTWNDLHRQRKLPYKRGQLSIYAKQMIGLVDLRMKIPAAALLSSSSSHKGLFRKSNGQTLLCRAIKENQPYSNPDLELAVRLVLCYVFFRRIEMLDVMYALTKLFSTHPHSIVGSLIYASQHGILLKKHLSRMWICFILCAIGVPKRTSHLKHGGSSSRLSAS